MIEPSLEVLAFKSSAAKGHCFLPASGGLIVLRASRLVESAVTGPRSSGSHRCPARRFGDLIRATASLRAYQADMTSQFVSVAAEVLAVRAGMSTDDPEPQIAARALLGLWHILAESLRKHLHGSAAPRRIRELVSADVRRAARLIEGGLRSFALA
jgi:hypothetical protein